MLLKRENLHNQSYIYYRNNDITRYYNRFNDKLFLNGKSVWRKYSIKNRIQGRYINNKIGYIKIEKKIQSYIPLINDIKI